MKTMHMRKLPDGFITAAKQQLLYNASTGIFTWRGSNVRVSRGGRAGQEIPSGGRMIGVLGHQLQEHRLAWAFMTGAWPPNTVDHKNRKKNDNRWENLRLASMGQQRANTGISKANTSGMKGVRWEASRKKWQAYITAGNRTRNLGRFDDKNEAIKAYETAAREHFKEFATDVYGNPFPENSE